MSTLVAAVAFAAACSSGAQPPTVGDRETTSAPMTTRTHGTEPIIRGFGRNVLEGWLLACDNGRICRAQPRWSSGSLMIRRDPGAYGLIRVVLNGQEPGEPPRPDPASIRLAGVDSMPATRWQLDQEGDRLTLEGDAALDFVRTLTRASMLSYDTSEGRLEIGLAGLREALSAMDEAQGHAGTEAAFVAVGARPRRTLAEAPPLPVIDMVPPDPPEQLPAAFAARARRASARLLAQFECNSDRRELDEAHALSATEAIVILPCGHGNVSSSYVLVRAARVGPLNVRPIALPRPPEESPGEDGDAPIYTDVEWQPGAIESRGHSCAGGCGFSSRWVYDGREFVLASHLVYEMGGAEALHLFRSEVREASR